jgi:rSAM/selenodomain-associated transferase 1
VVVSDDLLLVFAKALRPGSVKSRLAAEVGAEAATALYRLLAEEALRRTRPEAGEYRRVVAFAPGNAAAEMAQWLPGETLRPQVDGDLGARMAGAFAAAFDEGAGRVVLIGTDVPWVSRGAVVAALGRLQECDLVLGPAADGGYYLIGLGRPQPGLFQGIAWSTASVLAATLDRASALGLSVQMLEALPDIDGVEDLRRQWEPLRPLLAPHPALRAALESALRVRRAT